MILSAVLARGGENVNFLTQMRTKCVLNVYHFLQQIRTYCVLICPFFPLNVDL